MQAQHAAYAWTGLTLLLWGGSASAFKLALARISPANLLWSSCLISLIALLLLMTAQGKPGRLRELTTRQWKSLLLLGVLNPFLYYVILFEAYDRLPAQVAMSLNYLWPVVLALLSVPLLGQRLGWQGLMPILLSFAGAVLIASRGRFEGWQELSGLGLMLALGSTLVWAGYWLYSTRLREIDASVKLFVAFLVGAPLALLHAGLRQQLQLPDADFPWLAVAYVGLFEMGLTFFIWQLALSLAPRAATIGNLIYLTPFLSLMILSRLLDEKIHPATLWGLVLIISGILLQQYAQHRFPATTGSLT